MRLLKLLDDKNYEPGWKRSYREAVRAVILENGKIAMVKSLKEGWYKFPGGGIKAKESHEDALIRETMEETGLSIDPESIREFGLVMERRKGVYRPEEIFQQSSYYYRADVFAGVSSQQLDKYEADLGYMLEWADIREALDTDRRLAKESENTFLVREATVLQTLYAAYNK